MGQTGLSLCIERAGPVQNHTRLRKPRGGDEWTSRPPRDCPPRSRPRRVTDQSPWNPYRRLDGVDLVSTPTGRTGRAKNVTPAITLVTDQTRVCGFVGTFTDGESDGIYGCRIDASTGQVERGAVTESEDPSFLASHPSGETLYAANNTDPGTVTAFAIDRNAGRLTRLNSSPVGDDGPCHCRVDATGNYVLTAQYAGGSVSMLPIGADGRVGDPVCVVEHSGSGVDPERQTAPHPHSIVPGPRNRFAYVPDLGADRIAVYELALDDERLRPASTGDVAVRDGAGPRHLAFHPADQYAYLVNELDSTLVAFDYDPTTGALDRVATRRTIPASFDGENYPADVHVHPSGDVVYCSNRGHDSIAVFELDGSGRPSRTTTVSTRGEWPRHFAVRPDGDFLFAANQHSGTVVTFEVGSGGRELNPTGDVAEFPDPVCLELL